MNLRIATEEDMEMLKHYSINFLSTIEYKNYYDKETLDSLILDILKAPKDKYMCLIAEGGMIAGFAQPFLFNKDILVASEIAWWVEPDMRGTGLGQELLEGFEYWAKEKAGCKLVTMVSLDETLGKFYEKNGYKLYERAYMKDL